MQSSISKIEVCCNALTVLYFNSMTNYHIEPSTTTCDHIGLRTTNVVVCGHTVVYSLVILSVFLTLLYL